MMFDVAKELKVMCDAVECTERDTCMIYKFLHYEPLILNITNYTKKDMFYTSFDENDKVYYHMDIGVCNKWAGTLRCAQ